MKRQKDIVLFDPDCPLCRQIKGILEKVVKFRNIPMRFVPITDQKIFKNIPGLNYWECRQVIHLVTRQGEILKGEKVLDYILIILSPPIFVPLIHTRGGKILIKLLHKEVSDLRKVLLKSYAKDCKACQI